MNVLFTGGSSPLGARVLARLLKREELHVWAGVHKRRVPLEHPRLRCVDLDIESPVLKLTPDRVIHFAAVTHAEDPDRYWQVNKEGTLKLAEEARHRGCRSFVYVSTRCATQGSGAYGESKLAAEKALQEMGFEHLLILRPSEIYGGGGNEGIDRMIMLAKKWHVVPFMFGDRRLRFAPLLIDDFVARVVELIDTDGVVELCGPEDLSSRELAMRIARRYHALPIPLWWPGVVFGLSVLRHFNVSPVKPDQIGRATGDKTCYQSFENTELKRFLV